MFKKIMFTFEFNSIAEKSKVYDIFFYIYIKHVSQKLTISHKLLLCMLYEL